MNREEKKELLRQTIQLQMETKSSLDKLRFIQDHTGYVLDAEINKRLDFLLSLKKLEIELSK